LGEISGFIYAKCLFNNRLIKYVGSHNIDASLLWVSVPFNLFHPNDLIMKNTVKDIENQLLHGGGVHRYPQDTYYGGGEWLLLSSWLGWYYCKAGRTAEAIEMLKWVESQADTYGNMPEQVSCHLLSYADIQKWIDQWGQIATPLLWSHAMYLVLDKELQRH
jgi:GH15 family glucan-1,4-alpha-glucosidase